MSQPRSVPGFPARSPARRLHQQQLELQLQNQQHRRAMNLEGVDEDGLMSEDEDDRLSDSD